MNLVNKAIAFAEKAHRGQFRKYNTDVAYFVHPVRVAQKLCIHEYDNEEILCAAYLHDVPEDCGVSFDTIEKEFGPFVRRLVCDLTQADKIDDELRKKSRSERHAANVEKLKNIGYWAKAIKICDRWDNLEDINLSNPECVGFLKRRYLQESMDIYRVLSDCHYFLSNNLHATIVDLADKLGVELK